ncbi:UTP--glucose-1-phosphate uridylyltransferase-like [Diaphorina citri]|uniref:UTP--glucose-1-phosphate uridylyltransferase-like n=1 Tax=Diaphorina citri TaxID=121845 RepID=A0A3Q0JDB0_DIACI|nr:UTP--glucose-1-phosphate uridylyltransferase-like [Diaphorina citri]
MVSGENNSQQVSAYGWKGINVPLEDEGKKSHKRQPSDSQEFKEITKRDAFISLDHDLQHIISTEPDEQKRETTKKEIEGFKKLYLRFLSEKGPSVIWDKIEKLPEDAVSSSTYYRGISGY